MDDLWFKRAIGLKFWGFETDPHALAASFKVLSEAHSKGEPLDSKNYPENQIIFAHVLEEHDHWGDATASLINDMGGIDYLLEFIAKLKPKNYWIFVNIPSEELHSNNSNGFSAESLQVISALKCDIGLNPF
jgi:hypothetical protein